MNKNYEIDPESIGYDGVLDVSEKFNKIVTPEIEAAIKELYDSYPQLKSQSNRELNQRAKDKDNGYTTGSYTYHDDIPWIQTYSGRRFNPTNPVSNAIVIQDIAQALSMQCRFSGHVNGFYSVAQHSVGVSYLCNSEDALWGLLHDAAEAYLVDIPSPLKRSEHFASYRDFEIKMQAAVCTRFELENKEPASVKLADQIMLATEARDLMSPLRSDWIQVCDPAPFKIDPLLPHEAKTLFLKRFFQLIGKPNYYEQYLEAELKT